MCRMSPYLNSLCLPLMLQGMTLSACCGIGGLGVASRLQAADTATNAKAGNPPAVATAAATRFVRFEKAKVYCGPSQDLYVTSELSRGTTVEVYHVTKDGWCGIRPPEGSHDWVAADHAYLLPGGKRAEIVGEKTPAWIGTRTTAARPSFRWQIELQPSQKVDVIGEVKQAIGTDKVRLWYKILPPPGEFRWIRGEALSDLPPSIRSTEGEQVTTAGHQDEEMSPVVQAKAQSIPRLAQESAGAEVEPEIQVASSEVIEGEEIVIGSVPQGWVMEDGVIVEEGAVIHEGMVVDEEGNYIEGEFPGDVVIDGNGGFQGEDGWVVDGAAGVCTTCNQPGCTMCDDSHQTDSFQHWNNIQAATPPGIKFRPLGRILGLIGFSVVEGERIGEVPCTGMQTCDCAGCRQHPSDLSPRYTGRLNHLPRPTRRSLLPRPDEYLGSSDSVLDRERFVSNPVPTLASPPERPMSGTTSLLTRNDVSNPPVGDWHGIVPATANEDMRFSTPEIQSAMMELTRRVAEPMDRWELADLAGQAKQWIEQSSDPIARGESRLLLERIENFESLWRRSQSLAQSAVAYSNSSLPSSLASSSSVTAQAVGFQRPVSPELTSPAASTSGIEAIPPTPIQRNADGTPASDASGWLVEVHSGEFGQPEFALTDDYGGLIAYVQPSPGMNLRRYLKQPVGIYGVRGYLPSLSARQIVAERIVRLR